MPDLETRHARASGHRASGIYSRAATCEELHWPWDIEEPRDASVECPQAERAGSAAGSPRVDGARAWLGVCAAGWCQARHEGPCWRVRRGEGLAARRTAQRCAAPVRRRAGSAGCAGVRGQECKQSSTGPLGVWWQGPAGWKAMSDNKTVQMLQVRRRARGGVSRGWRTSRQTFSSRGARLWCSLLPCARQRWCSLAPNDDFLTPCLALQGHGGGGRDEHLFGQADTRHAPPGARLVGRAHHLLHAQGRGAGRGEWAAGGTRVHEWPRARVAAPRRAQGLREGRGGPGGSGTGARGLASASRAAPVARAVAGCLADVSFPQIGWDNKANEVAWCNSKGGETVRRSANAEKRFHRIDGVATRETTNAIRHQFMKLPGSPLPSPTGSPVSRGSFGAGSPFSNPCSSLGSRSPSRTSQVSQ